VSALLFAVLLLGTAAWFLLPLTPALKELFRPSDAEPLTMVGQDSGDLMIFAEGFRNYLRSQVPEVVSTGVMKSGAADHLPDGTPFVHVNGRPEVLQEAADAQRLISQLVLASGPVQLPGGETFLLELYARDTFTGGPGAVYRAILGESDVRIGEGSTVLRWVHAEHNLTIGDGSHLSSRASAVGEMRLGEGVRFSRVRATRIIVGGENPLPPEIPAPLLAGTIKMPRSARQERGFIRVVGDLSIPPGASVLGTLVVRGTLRLGANARISGSAKVHGACHLETGAMVDGSLVCRSDIDLAKDCRVVGPVVADGDVRLGEGCSVGVPGHPASVVGADVVCETGSQIYGAVTARAVGQTAPARPAARAR
jgi:predicted acyltransferase (DUF342 family)